MTWTYALDLLGTFVFALSGVLAGMDRRFDIFGAGVLGMATAVGGGTLRDILIGTTPVGWMSDLNYLFLIGAAIPICFAFQSHILKLGKSLFLFDTVGIGLFTIIGIEKTLTAGLSPIVAVMMGTVSAVFGGVIRDILSNQIPLIFRKEIYASACIIGGCIYLMMQHFFHPSNVNMICSIVVVIVIRYAAVRFNWSLNFSSGNDM